MKTFRLILFLLLGLAVTVSCGRSDLAGHAAGTGGGGIVDDDDDSTHAEIDRIEFSQSGFVLVKGNVETFQLLLVYKDNYQEEITNRSQVYYNIII